MTPLPATAGAILAKPHFAGKSAPKKHSRPVMGRVASTPLAPRRTPQNVASAQPVAVEARTPVTPQGGSVERGKDAHIRELALAVLRETDAVRTAVPALWEVAEAYREQQLAGRAWRESTRGNNDYLIREVVAELGHLPIDEITAAHSRALLVRWADRPAAAKHRLELLARLRAFAQREGHRVGPDVLAGVRLPTINPRSRYLEIGEVASFGMALDLDEREQLTTQSIARCLRGLLLTGLRVSEFARLTWAEVDLGGNALHLTDSKVGARSVPIGDEVVRWLSCIRRENSCVCPGRGGWKARPVTTSGVRQALNRACKRAGLEDVTPHTLRHTWATHAYLSGVDLHTIQVVLGHTSAQQTETYLHASMRRAIPETTRVAGMLAAAMTGGAS
jgi:integrase/recombinase XerC